MIKIFRGFLSALLQEESDQSFPNRIHNQFQNIFQIAT